MTKTPVQNVNELSEAQKQLMDRAKEVMEVLTKEPAMKLEPFLRFSETGVRPDVRLVPINQPKDEDADTESTGDGEDETGDDKPTEPSDAVGSDTGSTN